jgi:DNA-directed RNA polymerase subunit RPC12/RpoP
VVFLTKEFRVPERMGAGASFDNGLVTESEGDRYFCHACHRILQLISTTNASNLVCPHCSSSFLEEIVPQSQTSVSGSREAVPYGVRTSNNSRNGTYLTLEQTRRITSATAMLRLLETQLREELEQLQHAFESANNEAGFGLIIRAGGNDATGSNGNQLSNKKFNKIMRGKIRDCDLTVDIVCSQPSCPICSEEFPVDSHATRLPCSHIFHRNCLIPWLELKQNCPICRTSVTDEVPSFAEIEALPLPVMTSWLRDLRGEDKDDNVTGDGDQNSGLSTVVESCIAPGSTSKEEGGEMDKPTNDNGDHNERGLSALLPATADARCGGEGCIAADYKGCESKENAEGSGIKISSGSGARPSYDTSNESQSKQGGVVFDKSADVKKEAK